MSAFTIFYSAVCHLFCHNSQSYCTVIVTKRVREIELLILNSAATKHVPEILVELIFRFLVKMKLTFPVNVCCENRGDQCILKSGNIQKKSYSV